MKMVSLKQAQEVTGKVGMNCHWDEVSTDQAQEAVRDPVRLGVEFTRFLQNGGRVIVPADGIFPPPGGKIQILSVPVNESRFWKDAVNSVKEFGHQDSGDIEKVGDQYPAVFSGGFPKFKQVVLINFGEDRVVRSTEVLAWGEEQNLAPASPRACFAIGEFFPKLDNYFGPLVEVNVVSLIPCSFKGSMQVIVVNWYRTIRRIFLRRFDTERHGCVWFSFVRE